MANWFECKVKYDKLQENGSAKKVSEPYLVVDAVKRTRIAEIFFFEGGDRWYMAKVAFITIDEKTASEKRSVQQTLVQASNFKEAYENLLKGMADTLADYEIVQISETPLMDVYKMKVVD